MVSADLTGVTVAYTGVYPDPVVIGGIPTHNGDEEMAVRITGITQSSISLYADIPNHAAGEGAICGSNSHAEEMFGFLIISSGIYTGGIEANSGTYGQCSGGSLAEDDVPRRGSAPCRWLPQARHQRRSQRSGVRVPRRPFLTRVRRRLRMQSRRPDLVLVKAVRGSLCLARQ